MEYKTIVILNDGDTWSTVNGCCLAVISQADLDKLEAGTIEAKDLEPIMELGIRDITL